MKLHSLFRHTRRAVVLAGTVMALAWAVPAPAAAGDRLRDVGGERARRVSGMGITFDIEGLELLDEIWANRQNPEPPLFCGPVTVHGGHPGVWVSDVDEDYGRYTTDVTFYIGEGGEMSPLTGVEAAAPPTAVPNGCAHPRYWHTQEAAPTVQAVTATDTYDNAVALLPPGSWPGGVGVPVVKDEDQPHAQLFADYDILKVGAAVDEEWLHLFLTVDGEVSEGTSTPMAGHMYGLLILDAREGDRVLHDRARGFVVQYMPLYRLMNQPPQILLRSRQELAKMEEDDVEASTQGGTVHWRIRRRALDFDGSRPFKIIGFTGEVTNAGPTVTLDVKDVTATGQLQE